MRVLETAAAVLCVVVHLWLIAWSRSGVCGGVGGSEMGLQHGVEGPGGFWVRPWCLEHYMGC